MRVPEKAKKRPPPSPEEESSSSEEEVEVKKAKKPVPKTNKDAVRKPQKETKEPKKKKIKKFDNPFSKKNMRNIAHNSGLQISEDAIVYLLTKDNPREVLQAVCLVMKLLEKIQIKKDHIDKISKLTEALKKLKQL